MSQHARAKPPSASRSFTKTDGESRDTPESRASFMADVLDGLGRTQKSLPPKYFYDKKGCQLFIEITHQPEYTVTRTEASLLREHVEGIGALLDSPSTLIELGGVSPGRTETMLEALVSLRKYVPVDVAPDSLAMARTLAHRVRPDIVVDSVMADFASGLDLPVLTNDPDTLVFFPGSSVSNLEPHDVVTFLDHLARSLGNGRLLIGVDRKKPKEVLEAAYNDRNGATAAFNLNLLTRINRELGFNFDTSKFAHYARYVAERGRIEMHLVSLAEQAVSLGRRRFDFRRGESIHTENSYKYGVDEFTRLARSAGWSSVATWTDPEELFALHLLRV